MAAATTPTLRELVSDELNFEIWSAMMKTTLTEQGIWDVVQTEIPTDPSKNPDLAATLEVEELCRWRELVRQDMKALQILQSSLPDSLFRKTLSATSAKELWEMLEQVPDHVSYAFYRTDVTYDANMWMVYTTTKNHMTPHEKYFTALDRTRKARVTFINGSSVMAQGTGDVSVVTKEGKMKTIKDVLYVPGIVANALSVGQLSRNGYDVKMGTELVTIRDRVTGLVFGEAKWAENIGCLNVISLLRLSSSLIVDLMII